MPSRLGVLSVDIQDAANAEVGVDVGWILLGDPAKQGKGFFAIATGLEILRLLVERGGVRGRRLLGMRRGC